MVKRLYQIIAETPIKRHLPPRSHIGKFLEREILNAFARYRERPIKSIQIHSSQIIFNNIKQLAELGKKHISLRYIRSFEKEMTYDFIKLN
ncbi:hypothetical protein ES703_107318 [subsurface metagenome]